MLIRDREYGTYLMYLPHLAFPLAASLIVIPLEQEVTNNKRVKARREMSDFFIVVGVSLKKLDLKRNVFFTMLL